MKMVLDTSAIVPLLHQEEQTDNAYRFFELCHKYGIFLSISPLVTYEIGNCILTLSRTEDKDAKTFLENYLGMDLRSIHSDDDLLYESLDLAIKKKLTFYDAVHAIGGVRESAPLITLDKELLTRIDNSMSIKEAVDFIIGSFGNQG